MPSSPLPGPPCRRPLCIPRTPPGARPCASSTLRWRWASLASSTSLWMLPSTATPRMCEPPAGWAACAAVLWAPPPLACPFFLPPHPHTHRPLTSTLPPAGQPHAAARVPAVPRARHLQPGRRGHAALRPARPARHAPPVRPFPCRRAAWHAACSPTASPRSPSSAWWRAPLASTWRATAPPPRGLTPRWPPPSRQAG